jgi:hypothetical protein
MTDPISVEKLEACPYFQRAKSPLYKGTAIDEQSGYGYCYAYGTGYLRVPSVLELKEYCLGDLHFRCPAYNWLKEKGRLSLVGKPSSK